MKKEIFGKLNTGENIYKFTLSNGVISLAILEYGASIQSLKFNGKEMVLGYDHLEDYIKGTDYFGAIIGRYANRIDNGHFILNGREYTLFQNFGTSSLHGGKEGFNTKKWQACAEEDKLILYYLSKDGEEGYPGNLDVKVVYSLLEDGVAIEYQAVSDKDTPINLTNHTYFNLTGGEYSIEDYSLTLDADSYTPLNEKFVTTGEICSVDNTPFDFRIPKKICRDIEKDNEQLRIAGGYDHNFVLNGKGFRKFAEIYSETSKTAMNVSTDLIGVQFYTGNLLKDGSTIADHKVIHKRYGLCLETQFFPNAVNLPNFPSTILKSGEIYKSRTEYRFK